MGFFDEVLRLLVDLRIAFDVELAVNCLRLRHRTAFPPLLKNPLMQPWLPVGAGGEDSAREGEVLRVEFEDGEVGEAPLSGIEELVIEDASGLARLLPAEDPFPVWPQEGLRRLALDDAAQRFLPAVGAGERYDWSKMKSATASNIATTKIGTITRYRLMPVAFMAVSSLVRVSTPKVTRTATSTASGVMM